MSKKCVQKVSQKRSKKRTPLAIEPQGVQGTRRTQKERRKNAERNKRIKGIKGINKTYEHLAMLGYYFDTR